MRWCFWLIQLLYQHSYWWPPGWCCREEHQLHPATGLISENDVFHIWRYFFRLQNVRSTFFFSIFWSPSPIVNPVWVLVSGDPWISNLMGWYSLRLLESMKRPWMHNYKWDLLNGMFFYQKWKIWLNNVKHPPYSVSRYSPFDFHSMPSFVVVRDAVQRFPPHHRFRLGHQTPAASWW